MMHQLDIEEAFRLASKTQSEDLFDLAFEAEYNGLKVVSVDALRLHEIESKYNQQIEKDRLLRLTAELNNKGSILEKEGLITEAIAVYEENIKNGYPASHAFDRLRILYRKQKDYENLERVIRRKGEVYGLSDEDVNIEILRYCKQSEVSKVYPTSATVYPTPPKTLEDEYYAVIRKLPEFDFYTKVSKLDVLGISSDTPMGDFADAYFEELNQLREVRTKEQSIKKQASDWEAKGRYDKAAELYECLIANHTHDTVPYNKLVSIYKRAKLYGDALRVLESAVFFFTELQQEQYDYIHNLADKYHITEINGVPLDKYGRITYYNGAFTLYQEYTIVDRWKEELGKVKKKL